VTTTTGQSADSSRPLRLVLVDDEPLSRRALRQLLDLRSDVQVVAECGDTASARAHVGEADALLLDIELPDQSGLDLARELDTMPHLAIVFVTAFDEYAVPAFATEAVDYLCKPVAAERLDKALRRIRDHVTRHTPTAVSMAAPTATPYAATIAVRIGLTEELVPIADIVCVEADGVYATVHVGDRRLLVRQSLNALEQLLPSPDFLRVHRSWLVRRSAVHAVRSVKGTPHRLLLLHHGTRVPVSRRRLVQVLAWVRGEPPAPTVAP
jgi:two-component system LytT family response regulator